MNAVLLLLVSAVLPVQALDFEKDAAAVVSRAQAVHGSTLRVLTYNVFGVVPWGEEPGPGTGEAEILTHYTNIGHEFARLRSAGQAPQIVVLQEAFHILTDVIPNLSGYPHVARGAGAKLPRKPMRSGLVVMSEFPIQDVVNEDFETCTSWDCYANKGFSVARVMVPGVPGGVLIYNTHMNADTPGTPIENSRRARMENAKQMPGFLARTRTKGEPTIFGGDFNFRPGDPDFKLVGGIPGIANAAETCIKGKDCGGDDFSGFFHDVIDHQYYWSSPTLTLRPVYIAQTFKGLNGGTKPPSDHLGVEVHYLLTTK